MENRRKCCTEGACPFAYSEASEQAQNYGCIPAPIDIINMRVIHGKTWACHSNDTKPCLGAQLFLERNALPYKYNKEDELVTLDSEWWKFTSGTKRLNTILKILDRKRVMQINIKVKNVLFE